MSEFIISVLLGFSIIINFWLSLRYYYLFKILEAERNERLKNTRDGKDFSFLESGKHNTTDASRYSTKVRNKKA